MTVFGMSPKSRYEVTSEARPLWGYRVKIVSFVGVLWEKIEASVYSTPRLF